MIVIDASALVDMLLQGEALHPRAHLLKAEVLHAPHLVDIEVMHAIRRRGFREPISMERVETMLAIAAGLKITLHAHRPYLKRVWSLRHRCSAYDALYVALAEALACPLMTADGHLARAVDDLIEIERV